MSGNDDKSQAAAERIKAQALSAAKGLSRAQAERAAAAAARNVNAYGQKEEGPSRWQERKEAKRQMYLMSTEKAVILGVKPKAAQTSGGAYTQCQKCFQPGHWTYECKNERVYISRPSRTQQLKNPKLKKLATPVSYQFENPDLEKEREAERKLNKEKMKKEKAEKNKLKSKRKHRARSDSDGNSSEASVFDSDTESSVSGSEYSSGTSSSYSSSDSEDKKRQYKRKQKKRRHRRETSSSASSESESASDSDSDDKGSRRKSRRRGDRH